MSYFIVGHKPSHYLGAYLQFDTFDQWTACWALTKHAARDELTDTYWELGAADGISVSLEEANAFADAIERLPRGDLLVKHRTLSNERVDRYVAFLRACGGFRTDWK